MLTSQERENIIGWAYWWLKEAAETNTKSAYCDVDKVCCDDIAKVWFLMRFIDRAKSVYVKEVCREETETIIVEGQPATLILEWIGVPENFDLFNGRFYGLDDGFAWRDSISSPQYGQFSQIPIRPTLEENAQEFVDWINWYGQNIPTTDPSGATISASLNGTTITFTTSIGTSFFNGASQLGFRIVDQRLWFGSNPNQLYFLDGGTDDTTETVTTEVCENVLTEEIDTLYRRLQCLIGLSTVTDCPTNCFPCDPNPPTPPTPPNPCDCPDECPITKGGSQACTYRVEGIETNYGRAIFLDFCNLDQAYTDELGGVDTLAVVFGGEIPLYGVSLDENYGDITSIFGTVFPTAEQMVDYLVSLPYISGVSATKLSACTMRIDVTDDYVIDNGEFSTNMYFAFQITAFIEDSYPIIQGNQIDLNGLTVMTYEGSNNYLLDAVPGFRIENTQFQVLRNGVWTTETPVGGVYESSDPFTAWRIIDGLNNVIDEGVPEVNCTGGEPITVLQKVCFTLQDHETRIEELENNPSGTQVQSNWEEANPASPAFIQNKPAIPTVPTQVSAFANDSGYITSAGLITLQPLVTYYDLAGHTGDTNATIVLSFQVNANQWLANGRYAINVETQKTGTGAADFTIYLNTSATIGGIPVASFNSTQNAHRWMRNFTVKPGFIRYTTGSLTQVTDWQNGSFANAQTTEAVLNRNQTLFFVCVIQNAANAVNSSFLTINIRAI